MCYLLLAPKNKFYKTQKQSPRGGALKRCSANPHQIYSRAPIWKRYEPFFEITFPYGSPPINLKRNYGGLLKIIRLYM